MSNPINLLSLIQQGAHKQGKNLLTASVHDVVEFVQKRIPDADSRLIGSLLDDRRTRFRIQRLSRWGLPTRHRKPKKQQKTRPLSRSYTPNYSWM
jgi:hypothetical protein